MHAEILVRAARGQESLETRDDVVGPLRVRGLRRNPGGLVDKHDVGVLVHDPGVPEVWPDAGSVHGAGLHITL